ncbi:MAG: hypothetical protein F6K39_38550 [Okeania sp. SIO3B3]|nr:hypothetical protein [Okeania sp. SIO3B3]
MPLNPIPVRANRDSPLLPTPYSQGNVAKLLRNGITQKTNLYNICRGVLLRNI